MINWLQIQKFTKTNNFHIIFFSTKYSLTKKDYNQIIDNIDLLIVQNGKKMYISLAILYYY